MPGLYTHTTRATGTTLTADIYNTDHQNHITNADAANLGGHSANATQMQATADPGEVSSESLASSIADELERLRFAIKEMRNTSQWYTSTVARTETLLWTMTLNGTGAAAADPFHWSPSEEAQARLSWRVPEAYASGDVTFNFVYQWTGTGTGTAKMLYYTFRQRIGAATVSIDNAVSFDLTDTDTNANRIFRAVSAAQFTVGDFLIYAVARDSSDAGDTATTALFPVAAYVTYTAYAGRP